MDGTIAEAIMFRFPIFLKLYTFAVVCSHYNTPCATCSHFNSPLLILFEFFLPFHSMFLHSGSPLMVHLTCDGFLCLEFSTDV